MSDIKILYCYDEFGNEVYYNNAIKGVEYYCTECGEELILKDGKVKAKHLSHKTNSNCIGTGESIFHKHWKTSLFKVGLIINTDKGDAEILNVLNEIPLSKRYNMDWDREIIVDTLLETNLGDIIVEIFYTHCKDWAEMEPYYSQLKLGGVYEVKVNRYLNEPIVWKDAMTLMKIASTKRLAKLEKEAEYNTIKKAKLYLPLDNKSICYHAPEDETMIYGMLYEEYYKSNKECHITVKGNIKPKLKDLVGKVDIRLDKLVSEIVRRKVGFKKGVLFGKTYDHRDIIKQYGCKWTEETKSWDANGTKLMELLNPHYIEFEYSGFNLSKRDEDIVVDKYEII